MFSPGALRRYREAVPNVRPVVSIRALEQKYWFETLGFFVDADCVNCQDCRHDEYTFKDDTDRYGDLLAKDGKSDAEWSELSELGDLLFARGYIKKAETLLKTRRPKRMRK